MNSTFALFLFLVFLSPYQFAQQSEWTVYHTGNSGLPDNTVNAIAFDNEGVSWIGTNGGLAKYDGTTWTVYDTTNSPLQDNLITVIAIDDMGVKWLGTQDGGLARFDGTTWTIYTTANSGIAGNSVSSLAFGNAGVLWVGTNDNGIARFDGTAWKGYKWLDGFMPNDNIRSLVVDSSGIVWIGTAAYGMPQSSRGLVGFDGTTNWRLFNQLNSDIPCDFIESLTIDASGALWIGMLKSAIDLPGGVARYNGTTWTTFTKNNSGLPHNWVKCIAIDTKDKKWIATWGGGLATLDGSTWTVYDSTNSGLPSNSVFCVAVTGNGVKWIGTRNGLAKFVGGVVSVRDGVPGGFMLQQNYPNPFNPSTRISFEVPVRSDVSLVVFNALGQEVETVAHGIHEAGRYEVEFNAVALPSGVYFYRLQAGEFTQTQKMMLLR